MPIYQYRCRECNIEVETYQNINDGAPGCPECSAKMYKIILPTAVATMKEHWFKERIGRHTVEAKTYNDLEREAKKLGFEVISGKEAGCKEKVTE